MTLQIVVAAVLAMIASAAAVLGVMGREEARTRLERLPYAVLRLARRRLQPDLRVRWHDQEWLPEMQYVVRQTDGLPLTRLARGTWFAMGALWSAPRLNLAAGRPCAARREIVGLYLDVFRAAVRLVLRAGRPVRPHAATGGLAYAIITVGAHDVASDTDGRLSALLDRDIKAKLLGEVQAPLADLWAVTRDEHWRSPDLVIAHESRYRAQARLIARSGVQPTIRTVRYLAVHGRALVSMLDIDATTIV